MTTKTRTFRSPLVDQTRGRLVYPNGVSPRLTIHSDADDQHLFRAEFRGSLPDVSAEGHTVTVRFRDIPIIGGLLHPPKPSTIALNSTVPWTIEVHGGVGGVVADLRRLRLESVSIDGGVSRMALQLGSPSGTVPIRISRGASGVSILRSSGVPASVRIDGGASDLTLDQQHFGAVGSSTHWESPDYPSSVDRYAIHVSSGVAGFSVSTEPIKN